MNKEITDIKAIEIMQGLIDKKTKELNNTPIFFEEERENLEMEISSYKRHLEWIKRGCCD